jgi:hypothetical protein
MNRTVWTVLGVAVFALGVISIVLGMNLVPPMAVAQERGVVAGWWLIWTVIALTVACTVALGGFLVAAGMGKVPETAD